MNKKEQVIRERRTVDAIDKGLMGVNGRLGTICKYLGQAIQQQGGGLMDRTELEDVWLLEDDEGMPTLDEDEVSQTIGYVFDGLSLGMHIEIRYLEWQKDIVCYYKGYEVYRENNGELMAYAPAQEWLEKVDYLFSRAKSSEKARRAAEEAAMQEFAMQKQAAFLDDMKKRWGLK